MISAQWGIIYGPCVLTAAATAAAIYWVQVRTACLFSAARQRRGGGCGSRRPQLILGEGAGANLAAKKTAYVMPIAWIQGPIEVFIRGECFASLR